jgi:hypothetical protein
MPAQFSAASVVVKTSEIRRELGVEGETNVTSAR